MNSILIKALMKYHNDFFKMTEEEQDSFKLEEHDELDDQIEKFIGDAIGWTKKDKSDDDYEYNPEKQFEYNKIILPYYGIGKGHFMLNEFGQNKKIVENNNLYDYNKNYHEWQEEAFSSDENFPEYKKDELYNRFTAWARLEINNKFNYLNLLSFDIWMYYRLDEVSFDWIDKEIPHEFVSGPNDGKKTKGGFEWDKVIDANGLEGWYEQISDFSRKWIEADYKKNRHFNDKVYMIDTTFGELDPAMDFIFGSLDILKELHFDNFLEDCDKVRGKNVDILKYRDEKIAEFTQAMDDALVEIKKSPPNVVKLKKKRKINMTAQAMNDLDDLE